MKTYRQKTLQSFLRSVENYKFMHHYARRDDININDLRYIFDAATDDLPLFASADYFDRYADAIGANLNEQSAEFLAQAYKYSQQQQQ